MHAETIRTARPLVPQDLGDRAAEIWEPLLALADLAGRMWPELVRTAAVSLNAKAQELSPTASLLSDSTLSFYAITPTGSGPERLLRR